MECGHNFGYHSNGVAKMPWDSRGWDHGDDSEEATPISPAPSQRTPVYWVAAACVDGVLGCAYVFYKDPRDKKKGLSQKVWNYESSETKIETAELEALSKCIKNVQSLDNKAMIIHTTSQLWFSNLLFSCSFCA